MFFNSVLLKEKLRLDIFCVVELRDSSIHDGVSP